MLFNSAEYALFLPLVLLLYRASGFHMQNAILLGASYVFYGAWDWRFLSLIAASTVIDFLVARAIGRTENAKTRRRYLIGSIGANLGILAIFKYYGFFVESALGFLSWFGLHPNPPLLEVLLPVGISFYTFQTISYTFDVYRRRIEPVGDVLTFATYVAYFPQLVAGPIERAKHLLPQIGSPRQRPSSEAVRSALFLTLLGLFKKVAVADAVAPIVDKAFTAGGRAGSGALVMGMLAFSLQIYGDFSGYSDIARGTSRLFGIELVRNFEQPYLSRNITEFWRNWHISLSAWLHDYLYVPLGGNRNGRLRTYRNLLLTMLLGGLWHGAAWTFIVWGGLHGLLLAGHRALGGGGKRDRPEAVRIVDVPRVAATFLSVSVLWIFFRSPSLAGALDYLTGLFGSWGIVDPDWIALVGISGVLVLVIDIAQRRSGSHSVVLRWSPLPRGAAVAILLAGVAIWTGGSAQPFIYFQF